MAWIAISVSERISSKEIHEPHMKTVLTGISMVKKKMFEEDKPKSQK